MKNLYKFVFLLLLTPMFGVAQSNFKPGYVVTSKGDTIKGFIDYREQDNNPESFHFKSSDNDKATTTYTLEDATAFGINGFEVFQRNTVNVSQNRMEYALTNTTIDTAHHPKTVFLRVLVKGSNISLYTYSDNIKQRFYIADANTAPNEELAYFLFTNNQNGSLQYNYRFRVQLNFAAQKYHTYNNALNTKISEAKYTEKDLVQLALLINNSGSAQQLSNKNAGAQFFAGGGVNYNTLKYTRGIELATGNNAKTSNSPLPYLSAGIDLFTNKEIQKLFLRFEAILTGDHHSSEADIPQTPTTIAGHYSLAFTQYTLGINPQVGYNFYNTKNLKVFLALGVSINFSTYNNYNYLITYTDPFYKPETKNKYPTFVNSWLQKPTIKAGIQLNQKFDLYAGVMPATNIIKFEVHGDGISADLASYQLGMHYRFK